MNRSIVAMIVAVVVATVAVVAGATYLLQTGPGADDAAAPATETTLAEAPAENSEEDVPARPDCPADGAGGVALPCLGGEAGAQPQAEGITVVNLWAWWCGPCRDELPYFDDFAAQHPEYTVVGVHADGNPGNGAAFLNDLGIEMPSYQDSENTFAGTLGLPAVVPITVIFEGTEQLAMYPQPFESTAELAAAVDEAVAAAEV